MRVLHLNDHGRHVGGVEAYISDVSTALTAANHSTRLLYSVGPVGGDLVADTIYSPVPEWPTPLGATGDRLTAEINRFQPDVAYIHAVSHPALLSWVAARVRTVVYVHSPLPVCPGAGQYLRRSRVPCPRTHGFGCLLSAQVERCCWGRDPLRHLELLRRTRAFVDGLSIVHRVLVGSRYMRSLVVRAGIRPERIAIVPPILFAAPPPPVIANPTATQVLFAGRLVPEKGLTDLLEALADMPGTWSLTVAGDGPERTSAEQAARSFGIHDRVSFTGWLTGDGLRAAVDESAVVALPSRWPEPFGRIGPEAAVRGRPVVAYDSGGVADWLSHGVTGYLVPIGDVAGMRARLAELLSDPIRRSELGQAAWLQAASRWRVEDHLAHFWAAVDPTV